MKLSSVVLTSTYFTIFGSQWYRYASAAASINFVPYVLARNCIFLHIDMLPNLKYMSKVLINENNDSDWPE